MQRRFSIVVMAALALGPGCAPALQLPAAPVVGAQETTPGFATMTVDELHALPTSQRPLLIDVREPSEYNAGHVPGAVNVPLSTVAAWSGSQSATAPVLVICQSGRRSAVASRTLVTKGFRRVTNVDGGTGEWIDKGYPVERSR